MSTDRGDVLLALAREAIARALDPDCEPAPRPDWLGAPGATFVTLTRDSALRGCIGSLEAVRPIGEDVQRNAVAAAFSDPRFAPLRREEWPGLRVSVSELSPPEPLAHDGTEADALRRLRPGVDGLILSFGSHRATFLPKVWEQLPEPRAFLRALRAKAGLPPDFWHPSIRLSRYTAHEYAEEDANAGA